MFQKIIQRFSRQEGEEERQTLMESVRSTRSALSRAYDGFNRAADSDLIESYVYEINALQSRYAYLLKQIRQLEEAEVVR